MKTGRICLIFKNKGAPLERKLCKEDESTNHFKSFTDRLSLLSILLSVHQHFLRLVTTITIFDVDRGKKPNRQWDLLGHIAILVFQCFATLLDVSGLPPSIGTEFLEKFIRYQGRTPMMAKHCMFLPLAQLSTECVKGRREQGGVPIV